MSAYDGGCVVVTAGAAVTELGGSAVVAVDFDNGGGGLPGADCVLWRLYSVLVASGSDCYTPSRPLPTLCVVRLLLLLHHRSLLVAGTVVVGRATLLLLAAAAAAAS